VTAREKTPMTNRVELIVAERCPNGDAKRLP
jgi:hypothetical protein